VAAVWAQAAGRRRAGRAGKNKKTGWIHKLGAYVPRPDRGMTKELKDPPYIPQLSDLAEEHKLLCSSGI
jgi:hypothetical protein